MARRKPLVAQTTVRMPSELYRRLVRLSHTSGVGIGALMRAALMAKMDPWEAAVAADRTALISPRNR